MEICEFRLIFHWRLFLRVLLSIVYHWFRKWLGAVQATSHYLNQWLLVYQRIYASFGLNELSKKNKKTSKESSMNWRFVDEFEVTDDVLITVGYALSYLVAYSCIIIQWHGISNALNAKGLNVLFVMQRKIDLIWVYPMPWCINGSVCALYFIHMLCENVNVNVVSGTICSPINIPINNLQFQLTLPRALISSVASCAVPINQLINSMQQMSSYSINCHGRWVHELWKRWSPGWHEHFISYLYPVRLWFYAPKILQGHPPKQFATKTKQIAYMTDANYF